MHFAQGTRSRSDTEFQQALQRGFSLQQIPVAIDGLAVAIHPRMDIPGLTLNQLKAIYTGRINNWRQLGGPNFDIIPYSRPVNAGGTVQVFIEEILGGENFGENVQYVPDTTGALQKVASNADSIYFASAPEVVPQCTIASASGPQRWRVSAARSMSASAPSNQYGSFSNWSVPDGSAIFVSLSNKIAFIEQRTSETYANLLLTSQGQELIEKAGFVRIR